VQSSRQGIAQIRSAHGTQVGSGFIITRSGLMLASCSGRQCDGTLTVRLVASGKTFRARLVGSDPTASLGLMQLSGGSACSPVTIGTATDIHRGDSVVSTGGTDKGLLVSTGGITATNVSATIGGNLLTGLIEVSSLGQPAGEMGGPLLNGTSQVVGIAIAPGPGRTAGDGYVVPIDSALQIARQITGQQ
jgi:S1-C subfamily serine protease